MKLERPLRAQLATPKKLSSQELNPRGSAGKSGKECGDAGHAGTCSQDAVSLESPHPTKELAQAERCPESSYEFVLAQDALDTPAFPSAV